MPRRRVVAKREIQPDPLFKNKLLAKFINHLMRGGKKSIAEKIVYGALEVIKEKLKVDPLDVFERAIEHVKPLVEVKSRRVGGSTYQVPVEVRPDRALALAMRWIIDAARARSERDMLYKLAAELMDAADESSSTGSSTGKGGAIKIREDKHRMADANKAFSHYRW